MEFRLSLKPKFRLVCPLKVGDQIIRDEDAGIHKGLTIKYTISEINPLIDSNGLKDFRIFGSNPEEGWTRRFLFRASRYQSLINEGKVVKII